MFVKKPPMGFNTWNTFGEKINEDLIMETADAMVHEGLLDAGYEYLVIDDCWSEYDRDPKTHELVANHEKFPNGMKYVADYVHSKGLKFGMYSCADRTRPTPHIIYSPVACGEKNISAAIAECHAHTTIQKLSVGLTRFVAIVVFQVVHTP